MELKQLYSNYRALLQSHIADYLGYRLLAQVNEISRALDIALDHESDEDGLPDEMAVLLDRLFVDFVETLNALKEIKTSIAGVSKELYKVASSNIVCFTLFDFRFGDVWLSVESLKGLQALGPASQRRNSKIFLETAEMRMMRATQRRESRLWDFLRQVSPECAIGSRYRTPSLL